MHFRHFVPSKNGVYVGQATALGYLLLNYFEYSKKFLLFGSNIPLVFCRFVILCTGCTIGVVGVVGVIGVVGGVGGVVGVMGVVGG